MQMLWADSQCRGQEDVEELLSAGEEMAVEGEGGDEGDMEGAGMADDLAPVREA